MRVRVRVRVRRHTLIEICAIAPTAALQFTNTEDQQWSAVMASHVRIDDDATHIQGCDIVQSVRDNNGAASYIQWGMMMM